jgi:hypothetical protein
MAYSPTEAQASFLKATLWMIGLSILLFWLPIAGPVVAGLAGGAVGLVILFGDVPLVLAAIVGALVSRRA